MDVSSGRLTMLRKSRGFELTSNGELISYRFTQREGLAAGGACILAWMIPTGLQILVMQKEAEYPALIISVIGIISCGANICGLLGLSLLGLRIEVRVHPADNLLEVRKKVFTRARSTALRLDQFDKILIRRRIWYGLREARALAAGERGMGEIYRVQFGGAGFETINSFTSIEDARALARAASGLTRYPIRESSSAARVRSPSED